MKTCILGRYTGNGLAVILWVKTQIIEPVVDVRVNFLIGNNNIFYFPDNMFM